MNIIKKITALATLIGIIFGVYFYFEARYAKAADVQQIEKRLDYKILKDQYFDIQQRIWLLTDRYGENPEDKTIKAELRSLEQEKDEIEKQLDTLRTN